MTKGVAVTEQNIRGCDQLFISHNSSFYSLSFFIQLRWLAFIGVLLTFIDHHLYWPVGQQYERIGPILSALLGSADEAAEVYAIIGHRRGVSKYCGPSQRYWRIHCCGNPTVLDQHRGFHLVQPAIDTLRMTTTTCTCDPYPIPVACTMLVPRFAANGLLLCKHQLAASFGDHHRSNSVSRIGMKRAYMHNC